MKELRLRWSPRKSGFQVIPGDDIIGNGAQPFWIKGEKLADPDRFNQAAMDHYWPTLSVGDHCERIVDALREMEVSETPFQKLSGLQQIDASLAVLKLLDAESTVEECLGELESIAA